MTIRHYINQGSKTCTWGKRGTYKHAHHSVTGYVNHEAVKMLDGISEIIFDRHTMTIRRPGIMADGAVKLHFKKYASGAHFPIRGGDNKENLVGTYELDKVSSDEFILVRIKEPLTTENKRIKL